MKFHHFLSVVFSAINIHKTAIKGKINGIIKAELDKKTRMLPPAPQ